MIKMDKLTNDLCLFRAFFLLYSFFLALSGQAQERGGSPAQKNSEGQVWMCPADLNVPVLQEAKPYTRWWWLGSAVDSVGLDNQLTEFARVGIGGVEITPIYGVQGNEAHDIAYLSPRWMRMLRYVEERGTALGIETNMATGTGWPFGGPLVTKEDAAKKLVFQTETSASIGESGQKAVDMVKGVMALTGQKVKRAAPGGEGLVIDHFDHDAVAHYLERFDTAFAHQQVPFPHTMFNDSYEVYGADWTPKLYEEFERRRGYDLHPYIYIMCKKDSLRTDVDRRIVSDYRETLGELLLENFTMQWTDWAHRHGSITRNQAHGSPANLLDVYAAVDIPECEGFGLSDFGIRGLRRDPGFTKKNDSDISMLKYASSAAHVAGKPFTSSETFTWLTEHFRTSLSQCKPDLDLMFLSGVNHVFFHGSCYSPKDEPWPGWRFYASVDMTPYNPQWDAMPAFCRYISRCQSMLQWGEPDNDFLVYLPFYDMIYEQPGMVSLFDIHSMAERAPRFIEAIQTIIRNGYDVDYISDRYLLTDAYRRYDAVIIPDVRFMPVSTLRRLQAIAAEGKRVIFVGHYPEGVPGYGRLTTEAQEFATVLAQLRQSSLLASDYAEALSWAGGRMETMRTEHHLSCIRRTNPDGHHYFVSNLTPDDVDAFISLGVDDADVLFYDPMTGAVTRPAMRDGKVRLQLGSGESVILRTFHSVLSSVELHREFESLPVHPYCETVLSEQELNLRELSLTGGHKSDFVFGDGIGFTRSYLTDFKVPRIDGTRLLLDLGDVRESARIVLNGQEVATLFAVPFRYDITPYVKKGRNKLEVHVTSLPANRIAQMDRDGVKWRRFKEINVVDLNYKNTLYDQWAPVPSGLNSPVRFIICQQAGE